MSASRSLSYSEKYLNLQQQLAKIQYNPRDITDIQYNPRYIIDYKTSYQTEITFLTNRQLIAQNKQQDCEDKGVYIQLLGDILGFLQSRNKADIAIHVSANPGNSSSGYQLCIQNNVGRAVSLVEKEDLLFVNLYLQANRIFSNCKVLINILLNIKTKLQMGNISIQEASRQIAVKLYEQLPHLTKENQLKAKRLIVSYLQSEIDLSKVQDFMRDGFNKPMVNHEGQRYFPLTIDDFIFYNMSELESDRLFFQRMCQLLGVNVKIPQQQKQENELPFFQDKRMHEQYIPAFVKAVNDAYRKLEDKSKKHPNKQGALNHKKKKIHDFVDEMNQFINQVRLLQTDWNNIQKMSQSEQCGVNWGHIRDQCGNIEKTANKLKDDINILKKKRVSLWRQILGTSLLILGFGVFIASIPAMIIPPVGKAGLAIGTAMMAGGSLCFFKCETKAFKTANAIVDYNEKIRSRVRPDLLTLSS